MRAKLLAIPPDVAGRRSRQACLHLADTPEFREANVVMLFLTIPGEIETAELVLAAWRHAKTVLVPKVGFEQRHMIAIEIRSLETGLEPSSYGIREPINGEPCPLEDIDLIVVPALAFDRSGNRLGRGGGFYDRFLAHSQVTATTCGLGFAEQFLDELPTESHDQPLDMLATDREVLRFGAPPPADARDSKENQS